MKKSSIDYAAIEKYAALGEYENALALLSDPKNGEALFFTALIKLRQGDKDAYVEYLKLAVKNKCVKACGYLLDAYRAFDAEAEGKFVKKNLKTKDAITRYLCGKHFVESKEYKKALPVLFGAKELAFKEMEEETPFKRCYVELCPYACYFSRNVYAKINYQIMRVLEKIGVNQDRKTFIACWKESVAYSNDDTDRLVSTMAYLLNVVDNTLGLADYKNSLEAFPLMESLYAAADEETKAEYEDTYELIRRLHGEFIEREKERLARQNIVYSDGMVNKNFLTAGNILNAIAQGISNYASVAPASSSQSYEINGKIYQLGDDGYLYNDGIKSAYSVRSGNRLHVDGEGYNQHTELGYFNNHGNFISN